MLKIISGGQTGVDRAALDVALALGLSCGGYCPRGRKSEDGTIPEKYPLTETKSDEYSERTRLNVQSGDGTLILTTGRADRGTELTMELCSKFNKPFLEIDLTPEKKKADPGEWLSRNKIRVLNVAGNRESNAPGIYKAAFAFLLEQLASLT